MFWEGDQSLLAETEQNISAVLRAYEKPAFLMQKNGEGFVSNSGSLTQNATTWELKAYAPPLAPADLGDPAFKNRYGTKYALYSGSMANGISSEDLVIEMGKAGFMGFFGSGGLLPERVEKAILRIQSELPNGPYGFNLLNSPFEPALEQRMMDLFLKHGISTIEASAYLTLTSSLVRFRAAGLSRLPDGSIQIANRIIAKVSRKEIAKQVPAAALGRDAQTACLGRENHPGTG